MAIWPLFLFALYWSLQYVVETEPLPKEHLKEAILCLRRYIGEEVVHKSFRHFLSYGEYLGDLCEYANVNAIEQKIEKDAQDNGIKVQQCLVNKGLPDVFRKIRDYGSEKLTEIEIEMKLEEERMRATEPQQISSYETNSNLQEDMMYKESLGKLENELMESDEPQQVSPFEARLNLEKDKAIEERLRKLKELLMQLDESQPVSPFQAMEKDKATEEIFKKLEEELMRSDESQQVSPFQERLNLEKDKAIEENLRKLKEELMQPDESQQVSSFDTYLKEDMFDEIFERLSTTVKNDDKAGTSKTPQTSSSKQSLPRIDITSEVHESPKIAEKDFDETNPQKFSDLGKFIIGLCQKDDTVNFQELENDEDKQTAFNCLKDCLTKFLLRIERNLYQVKEKAINILKEMFNIKEEYRRKFTSQSKSFDQEFEEFLEDFKKDTKINVSANSFFKRVIYTKRKISEDDKAEISNKKQKISEDDGTDIGTIKLTGELLMSRYMQIYTFIHSNLSQCGTPPNKDVDPEIMSQYDAVFNKIDDLKSYDIQLGHFFSYYTSCAKVQCYMKAPESVPLYTLIHEKATRLASEIEEEMQIFSPELKFYCAFTRKLNDDN